MSASTRHEISLLEQARRQGFSLVCCEGGDGQQLWEWRRGTQPPPRFVSRRVAIEWMAERLVFPEFPAASARGEPIDAGPEP